MNYEVVVPVYWDALDIISWGVTYIEKYLKPKKITLIGPAKMKGQLPIGKHINFMDGNEIAEGMSKESIAAIINRIAPGRNAEKRAGWYLQQMIKLGYARRSQEEAYLVWDADTIPLRGLQFYDYDKKKSIFLSGGSHHHLVYYKSISRLFGQEIRPTREHTYVAHYMLMQNSIMSDMLDRIESNTKLEGMAWWEKIMYSIAPEDIGESGFSEFETYGEFVGLYYPECYCMKNDIRKYTSSRMFLGNHPKEELLIWAGRDYDILGFEARDPVKPFWNKVCNIGYQKIPYKKMIGFYEGLQKLRVSYLRQKLSRGVVKLKKILVKDKQEKNGKK